MSQDGVDLHTSLGYLLKEASSVLRAAMEDVLRPLGMSVTHYACLDCWLNARDCRTPSSRGAHS